MLKLPSGAGDQPSKIGWTACPLLYRKLLMYSVPCCAPGPATAARHRSAQIETAVPQECFIALLLLLLTRVGVGLPLPFFPLGELLLVLFLGQLDPADPEEPHLV